ncbi:MarR family transcriptional regulator [Tsukamurella sp. 8F]|uniref:MarR family winged helix-turn-helix transcriptional regulator n=1 Tax=unclassified Tsukamurella TaxID=2633480 RepID=UPI0023B9BDF6|nr:MULTISPECIES: MarR family transcriptional regulator [unclassified Tsukamurella]MDF0531544.1 MarR family transcriptional regulator [Tsukamurella sp. 8J]MDF0588844.1 MarR family transcriptional regulator [Tsukamurella sp. 8F]
MTDAELGELAASLRVSLGLLRRRLRAATTDGALPLPELTAIVRIDRLGPMTTASLARVEQISPQSMGATVRSLQDKGFLAGDPDPTDGRRVVLSLTEAGRAAVEAERAVRNRHLTRALQATLDPDEVRTLAAAVPLLQRVAEEL